MRTSQPLSGTSSKTRACRPAPFTPGAPHDSRIPRFREIPAASRAARCIVPRPRFCYAALRRPHEAAERGQKPHTGTFQGEGMGQDIFDLIVVLTLVFFAGRGHLHGFVGEVAGIVSLLRAFLYGPRTTPTDFHPK